MKQRRTWLGVIFVVIGLTLIAGISGCSTARDKAAADTDNAVVQPETLTDPLSADLRPDPELSPEEVVKIQVEALQNNDRQDRGIEVAFRFASPDNKTVTGPLYRFIRLVKNPAYRPILNHKRAEFAPIQLRGNEAQQMVTVITQKGQAVVYLWALTKQETAGCSGCWLTDSVTLFPTRRQDLQGI